MIKICWKTGHPIPDEDTRERMNQMRKHKALTDMALCSEKTLFPCHKIIVTKASSYIRGLLKMESDSSKLFVVVLGNTDQRHIESLLVFMYLGVHFIQPDDLPELSKLANMLHVGFVVENTMNATDIKELEPLMANPATIKEQTNPEIIENPISQPLRDVTKEKSHCSVPPDPEEPLKKRKKDSPFVKNLPVPVPRVPITTLTPIAKDFKVNSNKIQTKKRAVKTKKPAVKKQTKLSKKPSAKLVQNFTTPINQNTVNQSHPPLAQYSVTNRNQISVVKKLGANFTHKSPSETGVELAKRLTNKALRTIRRSSCNSLLNNNNSCKSFAIANRGKKLISPCVMNSCLKAIRIADDIHEDLDPKHEAAIKSPTVTRPKRNAYQKAKIKMANWIAGKADDT